MLFLGLVRNNELYFELQPFKLNCSATCRSLQE